MLKSTFAVIKLNISLNLNIYALCCHHCFTKSINYLCNSITNSKNYLHVIYLLELKTNNFAICDNIKKYS